MCIPEPVGEDIDKQLEQEESCEGALEREERQLGRAGRFLLSIMGLFYRALSKSASLVGLVGFF